VVGKIAITSFEQVLDYTQK